MKNLLTLKASWFEKNNKLKIIEKIGSLKYLKKQNMTKEKVLKEFLSRLENLIIDLGFKIFKIT